MLRIRTKPHPKRPGVFVASFEGKTLCISRTPLADGARILLRMGFPPAMLVTMRHWGANHDSFVPETLANWAARAYVETANGPKIIAWEPFPKDRRPRAPTGRDRTDDSDDPASPRPPQKDEPQ